MIKVSLWDVKIVLDRFKNVILFMKGMSSAIILVFLSVIHCWILKSYISVFTLITSEDIIFLSDP